MSKIELRSLNIHKHTLINNLFIDSYMPSANGDYVKVYIYLLRLIMSSQTDFTTKQLAKHLHLIESDVIRAIRYWDELKVIEATFLEDNTVESIGLLSLERPEEVITDQNTSYLSKKTPSSNIDNHSSSDQPTKTKPSTKSAKLYSRPEYSMEEVAMMAKETEFQQLLYITEKYLGKQLTQTDVNVLLGFVDWLGLPIDVVEFLIEYCASGGHRHMNYIEKIAIDWSDQNVTTVAQAKSLTERFNKNYYRILKALGIGNRQPTSPQIKIMDKWIDDYNFAVEVIELACEKTITAINKPELKYVDTILTRWHDNGAKSIKDVEALDSKFRASQEAKRDAQKSDTAKSSQSKPSKNNRFHNHDQRSYDHSLLNERMNALLESELDEEKRS